MMEQLVVLVTSVALEVLHVKTPFDLTVISLESEVGEAISTLSSLVPDAACLHSFADTLAGKEVAAFTSNTLVVIVGLAVLDLAISILQLEGTIAFLADMINLILAAQDRVHDTDVVVERVSVGTVGTGLFLLVGEFHTILNGHDTTTSSDEEA